MFGYRKLLGRLKAQMKDRRLTLEQAATAIDHDKSWLSSILNGKRNIYLHDFLALCRKSGLDPASMLSDDEETARLLDYWSRLDEAGRRHVLAAVAGIAATTEHPPATRGSRKRAG